MKRIWERADTQYSRYLLSRKFCAGNWRKMRRISVRKISVPAEIRKVHFLSRSLEHYHYDNPLDNCRWHHLQFPVPILCLCCMSYIDTARMSCPLSPPSMKPGLLCSKAWVPYVSSSLAPCSVVTVITNLSPLNIFKTFTNILYLPLWMLHYRRFLQSYCSV